LIIKSSPGFRIESYSETHTTYLPKTVQASFNTTKSISEIEEAPMGKLMV